MFALISDRFTFTLVLMRMAMLIGLLLFPGPVFGQDGTELDEQLREKPDDVELLLERAEALLALGRFDEALVDCDNAATRAPKDPSIALSRGRIHLAMGELELAELHFSNLLKGQPTIEVFLLRGSIREETRRFEEALADYDAARKLAAQLARQRDFAVLLQVIEIEEARARTLEALDRQREAKVAREHAAHLKSLAEAARARSDT